MVGQKNAAKSLLFVCIENSSRSQIAEGLARELGFEAVSAGTVPSTHINPLVIDVMREVGVNIAGKNTRALTADMIEEADIVVLTDATLEESIPRDLRKKMRKKVVVWNIPDPQGKSIEEIRFVRDAIKRMVESLTKNSSLTDC